MNEVEIKFKDHGKIRGGLLFLRPSVAIDMVREYREVNISILGVDGFILTDESTQPSMEESIDLSDSTSSCDDCWKMSEDFLSSKIQTKLYFEIVADS